MNTKLFFKRYSVSELNVIVLIILQLMVKIVIELKLSSEASLPSIYVVTIMLAIGWCIVIPLCILRIRLGYLFAAIFGFLHAILAILLPLLKICLDNHLPIASIVSIHGLLISAFSFIVYFRMKGEKGKVNYYLQKRDKEKIVPNSISHNIMYIILVVATVIRSIWIIAMEPFGSRRALEKLSDVGGIQSIAAHSIPYVIYPSIIILVFIYIGLFFKRSWGYLLSFIFGSGHVVLTFLLLIMHVSPGFGPAIVIPASLLMAIFGMLMYFDSKKKILL